MNIATSWKNEFRVEYLVADGWKLHGTYDQRWAADYALENIVKANEHRKPREVRAVRVLVIEIKRTVLDQQERRLDES